MDSIVTIPGCSILSESERIAVFKKAEYIPRDTRTTLDSQANAAVSLGSGRRQLLSTILFYRDYGTFKHAIYLFLVLTLRRRRCITPPLDEEEENEESRLLEAQARKELENDGCLPCYSLDLEFPLRNPPEKYQPIIGYWQSFLGIDDVVLRAESSDWWKFRMSQSRVRRRFRNKPFSEYINEVCERRQRHKLNGNVRLLLDPKQQSRLENWVEFQNYHFQGLEGFEKKRDRLKRELDDARRKAGDTDPAVSERAAEDVEAIQQLLEDAEQDLRRHKVLLQWIKQERRSMDPGCPTLIEEDDNDQDAVSKAVRTTSTRDRRMRRPEASVVLGKVRVSKAKPKKRNGPKAPQFKPAIQGSDATTQSSIPQALKRRETKPRHSKEERPLRQLRPQKVSKAKRFADASVKSMSVTPPRSAGQTRSLDRAGLKRRPAPQRRQLVGKNVLTRSGRISKRPVRCAPG